MREFGIGREVQKLDRLRQLEQGRGGEQEIVSKRDDGADYAGVACVLVGIVIGGLLLLSRLAGRIERGVGEIGIRQADLSRLRGHPVKMPERQHKLDRERKQRQPRASFIVRPEPLHAENALHRSAEASRPLRCYNITSGIAGGVNRACFVVQQFRRSV
jgi:hypothetical protein